MREAREEGGRTEGGEGGLRRRGREAAAGGRRRRREGAEDDSTQGGWTESRGQALTAGTKDTGCIGRKKLVVMTKAVAETSVGPSRRRAGGGRRGRRRPARRGWCVWVVRVVDGEQRTGDHQVGALLEQGLHACSLTLGLCAWLWLAFPCARLLCLRPQFLAGLPLSGQPARAGRELHAGQAPCTVRTHQRPPLSAPRQAAARGDTRVNVIQRS